MFLLFENKNTQQVATLERFAELDREKEWVMHETRNFHFGAFNKIVVR